jgi:putative membrane-bound dehydrogenase-like protein
MVHRLLSIVLLACLAAQTLAADPSGNRLAYLNGPLDPYYPHRNFARLTTPQWVGEPGVDCVITLGIDDMRDPAKYEAFLRPILERLKKIEGRAPVSIMTCQVKPDDPQLQAWLKEGLSIECHTADHPCPCLQKSDFAAAKSTYDRCVDQMGSIPGNQPVAFRTPCCDSLNTPSPRFWQHAFNATTPGGRFLQIDSSVFNIITGKDEELSREIRFNEKGEERFRRYIPFPSFVNTIEDYPYPYVIGNLCWQFPCVVPSDWSAQHVQKPNNPDTVRDWKYALDATVQKQGVFNLVYHPHNWIRAEQVVELIDYAQEKYGKRVKVLTFKECAERLTKNLLHGQRLRYAQGLGNGVRILDVNNDGFMDVVNLGDGRATYVWDPQAKQFNKLPPPAIELPSDRTRILWGVSGREQSTTVIQQHGGEIAAWRWRNDGWEQLPFSLQVGTTSVTAAILEDMDSDGRSELLVCDYSVVPEWRIYSLDEVRKKPEFPSILFSPHGNSERWIQSLRFIDVNQDGKKDILYSGPDRYSLTLFDVTQHSGWTKVFDIDRTQPQPGVPVIPPFIRADGTNNGVWQHSGKLWWQNEDTAKLPDLVDRVALADLKVVADKAVQEKQAKEQLQKQPAVPVGAAKVDITPDYKVRLSGYAARKSEHDGVDQKIFARAMAIGGDDGPGPAVVIAVDNCGVPAAMITAALEKINAKHKLPRERLVVASSHTHSAPWVNGFAPFIFPYDIPAEEQKHVDQYTEELTDNLAEAALAALKNRQPARLYHATGKTDFAANRRTPGGPVDHRVPILVAKSEKDGQEIAVLFNYACHNTTLGGGWNEISGDWSGFASEKLEADKPGLIALSLIGCGADANPTPRGTRELAQKYGHALAAEVQRLIASNPALISHQLATKLTHVDLPWQGIPTKEEFEKRAKEDGIVGHHARYFLKKLEENEAIDTPLNYPIATWTFGDDLVMVFLAGEVVVDYSIALFDRYQPEKLWVTAYANDVPCYIPSKRILREGGYEAESSLLYYRRPGRLANEVEDIILDAVQKLVPYDFYNAERQLEFPPAKSPSEALESFRLPPGFKIELVASEPLIVDPVAFDWAPDGSLWVVEMRDYPLGIDGKGTPGGRVKHLHDDDGDGRYDRASVFLDGIPYPTGVKVWRKGILVSAAPEIFYAEDTNGDDQADKRESLYRGFGEGNQQHRVNGLRWGLDNWLYIGNGDSGGEIESVKTGKRLAIGGRDLRIRPDTGDMEAQSGQTQYGRACDDWGNWFGGNNSQPMWHYTLDDHYLRRNPHVPSPNVRKQVSVTPGNAQVFPASKTLMRFNDFHTANRFTSACSPIVYRDRLLGDDYYGNSFVCEPVHNLVHREIMSIEGATFTSRRADSEQQSEFLASTDNWFRPSMVRTGPDGALWVSDMYRFVIEHPTWIPKTWQDKLDVRAGDDKGRIYRVYREEKKPRKMLNFSKANTNALVIILHSPNGWQRDMAQQMLLWRKDPQAAEPLRKLLKEAKPETARLHALCTLEGLGQLNEADILAALQDEGPAVRRHAIRCAEAWLEKSPEILNAVVNRHGDVDRFVRVQVAYSLGASKDRQALSALALLLSNHRDDAIITAAALSSARPDTLGELLGWVFATAPEPPPATERLLAMASALEDAKVINTAIARLIDDPNKLPELWQLRAMASVLESVGRNAKLRQALSPESQKSLQGRAQHVHHLATKGKGEPQLVAIRLLGSSLGEEGERIDLLKSLLDPQQPLDVQNAAAGALAQVGSKEAVATLLGNWSSKTPALRSRTLDLLLATPAGTKSLLAAIEKGGVPPQDLDIRRRQQLAGHKTEEIRNLAAKLFADKVDANRGKVIEEYAAALQKQSGDVARGKDVFAKKCSQCHKLDGVGHEIGPNLAALTDRSLPAMLAAVLDPNRAVEAKFVDYLAVTQDGRQHRGMLAAETSTSLTLVAQEGKQETILRSDLEELNSTGKSLMPEGLEKEVPPQAMADVLAYLGGFRPPSKPFPGNKPELIDSRDDGTLRIPASAARIYGPQIVYEEKYGNLGYWSSPEDRAAWDFTVRKEGKYTVTLDFACAPDSAGNTLALSVAGQKLTLKVPSTSSWDSYQGHLLGTVELGSGPAEMTVASEGPIHGALLDLRSIRLVPAK